MVDKSKKEYYLPETLQGAVVTHPNSLEPTKIDLEE